MIHKRAPGRPGPPGNNPPAASAAGHLPLNFPGSSVELPVDRGATNAWPYVALAHTA